MTPPKKKRGRPTKAQQLDRLKQEVGLELPLPTYIMNSPFYQELGEADQKRLLEWADYIRRYTNEQLSEPEYYAMTTIMWQAEKMDALQKDGELFDAKMAEECRRSKQAVMDKMEAYRGHAKKKSANNLDEIRKMFAIVEKEDGSELEINITERPARTQDAKFLEVIDLDDPPVRAGTDKGNSGHDSGIVDATSEEDQD